MAMTQPGQCKQPYPTMKHKHYYDALVPTVRMPMVRAGYAGKPGGLETV